MVPHPPLIVPEVGRGQEILIKDTIKAYQEAAGMAAELKPDTIVVISPHAVMYADYFHVSPGKKARGDFGQFMAPQAGEEAVYDEAFVRELDGLCGEDDFPMGTEGERKKSWTMERWSRCILSISITGITSWCESADPDCPLPTITGQAGTLP